MTPVREPDAPARFGEVFRVPAFRVLYSADLQSVVGDQLARVALSVLVFSRTGSASATALTYGLTYLPAVLGGFTLARLGDLWPRRGVMIACDVLRAAVFVLMAVPGLPLTAVGALLVVAVFVGPAFSASAVGLLAGVLTPPQFRTASGLRMTTNQLAQVVGFALGGVLTAALGVRTTLLVNALTYAVSALVLLVGLRRVGTVRAASPERDRPAGNVFGLLAEVLRQPRTRTFLLLSLLAGVFVVPESLAVPFAGQVGASTTEAGLLLAVIPLGGAAGVLWFVRVLGGGRRNVVARGMAVATGVPLVLTVLHPGLELAAALWFVSGFAAAYQVEVFVGLVQAVPDGRRSQLVSVCGSLLLGVQGIGPLVFGLVASALTPAAAVAIAGAIGTVSAVVVLMTGRVPS